MTRIEDRNRTESEAPRIHSISAITLFTANIQRAMQFYRALGFALKYEEEASAFASFTAGTSYLNLIETKERPQSTSWGRVILYVSDVDAFYRRALAQALQPETSPRDAPWGERYFHITDPDGHELSFAKPL